MKQTKKITILHSNDLHGDFLAEQVDEKLVGGVSMLSGYIEKVRAEQPNTIYAIAGDMFRGSVIDSEYKGLSTIEIMNALAPDVVTIGNHEVDYGIAHLLFIEKCARLPIINANLYIKNTSTRLFTPYKILRMDGMNILFIGIITEEVLAATKTDELIGSFVDIGEAAREVGNICNAYNAIDIDFTVLLTHIGFEEDKKLAAMLDPGLGRGRHHWRPQPHKVRGALQGQRHLHRASGHRHRRDRPVRHHGGHRPQRHRHLYLADGPHRRRSLSPGRGGGELHSALQERHLSEV